MFLIARLLIGNILYNDFHFHAWRWKTTLAYQVLVKREAVQSTGVVCGGTTDRLSPFGLSFFLSLSAFPVFMATIIPFPRASTELGNKLLLFWNPLSILCFLIDNKARTSTTNEQSSPFESVAKSETRLETRNIHLWRFSLASAHSVHIKAVH